MLWDIEEHCRIDFRIYEKKSLFSIESETIDGKQLSYVSEYYLDQRRPLATFSFYILPLMKNTNAKGRLFLTGRTLSS